jgi:nucleotide-binding universal stress UspA family protein
MYKQILLTVDGSELAEQALEHAVAMATCFNAELYLLRVVVPFGLLAPVPVESSTSEHYRRNMLNEAHAYLNDLQERLKETLGNRIHTQVIEGIVVDSILEYADFRGIDLIVMATHGRGGLGRWVFGSVAERVLHAAKVPIFLVDARKAISKSNEKTERHLMPFN